MSQTNKENQQQNEKLEEITKMPEKKMETIEENKEEINEPDRTRTPEYIRDVSHTQRNWEEWYAEQDRITGKIPLKKNNLKPRITFVHSKSKRKIEEWLDKNTDFMKTSYLRNISGYWRGYCEDTETAVLENYSDFTLTENKLKKFLGTKPLNQLLSVNYNTISRCPEIITKKVPNKFKWKIICSKNLPTEIDYEGSTTNWKTYFKEIIELD